VPTTLFDRRATVTVDTIQFTALDFAFKIEKSLKAEPNTCELEIYNLSDEHASQLEQLGVFGGKGSAKTTIGKGGKAKAKAATQGIPCKIEAGYKDATSLLWVGDLRTVFTVVDGPDLVTKLTSGDGEKAWQNARLHVSYGPKTPIDTALRAIARALGVGEGNLGKVVQKLKVAGTAMFPAGYVISGSASRELVDLARSADLEVSVQDGALQFLDRGKALAGQAIRLSSETGLIESPTVDNEGVLTAKTLMIPDMRPGVLIVLDAARLKGNYKVAKVVTSGDTAGTEWGHELTAKKF
jgi:hypothetical protein